MVVAICSSVAAWSGNLNSSPDLGARPPGRNASANPGCDSNSGTIAAHCAATVGEIRNPLRPYEIAGSNSFSNGSLPNLACSSTHAETAPGTVTEFQPTAGMALPPKYSGVHSAGERPDALRPCSCRPSQTMANASEPMPLDTGSTSVRVIAVAMAASTALPPSASIRRPAWAASGWDVHTTLAARTGLRGQA